MFYSLDPQHNNNNDQDTITDIKRRGASLARTDINRQDSLTNSGRDVFSKRNSELDPIRSGNYQAGGTKIMNFIKSGFHLSKLKSKSKVNLQEKRQSSLYDNPQSSKSEENLNGLEFDHYLTPIRVGNILLNAEDPIIYTNTYTSDGNSLYKKLVLLDNDCTIQPVHPSIVNGQNYCFQIIKRQRSAITNGQFCSVNINRESFTGSQITKSCSYNSSFGDNKSASTSCESVTIIRCTSTVQRNEWIMRLKKHINPNIECTVRHEDILKIWIQEAKNLLPKKRYFCEIKLDEILYGRTTIKIMNNMVFWGEEFDFTGLKAASAISISVYRIIDAKRKREKSDLVAVVNLPCSDFLQNTFTEKWYPPSVDIRISSDNLRFSHSKAPHFAHSNSDELQKSVIDATPMLRIKARYRPLEIIPINCYQPLIDCIVEDNIALVISLENHLKVKSKEEFVHTMLLILQKKERHIVFLADIVLTEVFKSDDNLILRGNSMASKAMECYLKIVGEKYLSTILKDIIAQVTTDEINCEVDPLRITNVKDISLIKSNQRKLLSLIDFVWNKIFHSSQLLPHELKSVFALIRVKIASNKRAPTNPSSMIDQVISSFLFLRFICPAIMSPFLFGLANEYPDRPCINRTFTLIAKCIQSLANLSQSYQGKEAYMGFLQNFLTSKTEQMRYFLNEISSKTMSIQPSDYFGDHQKGVSPKLDLSVDLGYQLAELSHQLSFHLREIEPKDYTPSLSKVRLILENISKTFPSVDSNEEHMSSLDSTGYHFRSQIPIPVHKKTLRHSSVLEKSDRKYSIPSSVTCLPQMRTDIEEDFSYIPDKYSQNLPVYSDKIQRIGNENYVDFESIELQFYDDPCMEDVFTPRLLPATKCLNEKEINKNWSKVVKESFTNSSPTDHLNLNGNSGTINPPGYESLNFPTKISHKSEVMPKSLQRHSSHVGVPLSQNLTNNSVHQPLNSPKLSVKRHANIFRRIKQYSNTNKVSVDIKSSEMPKISSPSLGFHLNLSVDNLGSFDNALGSENNGLHSSKSLLSVNQTKKVTTKNREHIGSVENMNSSMVQLFGRSSQSLSNSISSNVDLDSFVTNELKRLGYFFEYYHVQKPSVYEGNAVEQFKYRTLDENCLKRVLLKKYNFNRNDIVDHIQAGYRLLKSINRPDQLSTECIIKSIMEINKRIQSMIKVDYDKMQSMAIYNDSSRCNGETLATRLSLAQSNTESVTLSTQSLPSPLTKYSKQSPQSNLISSNSHGVNITKSLAVHGVFERY